MLAGRDGHVRPTPRRPRRGRCGQPGRCGPPHARRPQQHRAVERLERLGAVAGALRGDPHAVGAGVPNRLDHVGGRPGDHDNGGPLVHGQVPRLARLVIAGLARDENLARNSRPQGMQAAAGHGVRDVHCFPLLSFVAPAWVMCRFGARLPSGRVSGRHLVDGIGCPRAGAHRLAQRESPRPVRNPTAGTSIATPLLASPWDVLGQLLPPGAALSLARNIVYHVDIDITRPLVGCRPTRWPAADHGRHRAHPPAPGRCPHGRAGRHGMTRAGQRRDHRLPHGRGRDGPPARCYFCCPGTAAEPWVQRAERTLGLLAPARTSPASR